MKFNCDVNELIDKLSISTRVLSSKSASPILDCVCLTATEDTLEATCSNGMISVVSVINAVIDEPGSVALAGKFLLDVVRRLPQGTVVIETVKQTLCSVKCNSFSMKMASRLASEYPRLPVVSSEQFVTIKQQALKEMINKTSFAMATDDPRIVLNGCYLEFKGTDARMVALDGFRFAMKKIQVENAGYDLEAIIPSKTVSEIAKVLSDDCDAEARIMTGGNQMLIDLGDTKVYTSLVQGKYIRYEPLLNGKFTTDVVFDRDEMTSCVERAALIAREGSNKLIIFQIEQGCVTVKASSETSDLNEVVFGEVRGENMTIAFNVTYVTDVMRALDEGQAVLRLSSPVSSSLVLPFEGDDFAYIMLPVRIGA